MTAYDNDVLEALENGGKDGDGSRYEKGDKTTAVIQRAVVQPHAHFEGVTELMFTMKTAEGRTIKNGIEIAPLKTRDGEINQTALGIFAATMRNAGSDGSLSEVVNGAHEDIIGNTVKVEFGETKKGWVYPSIKGLVTEGEPGAVDEIATAFEGAEVASSGEGAAKGDDTDIF